MNKASSLSPLISNLPLKTIKKCAFDYKFNNLLNTVNIMMHAGQSINVHDHSSCELILAVKSKEGERSLHLFLQKEERWATRGEFPASGMR